MTLMHREENYAERVAIRQKTQAATHLHGRGHAYWALSVHARAHLERSEGYYFRVKSKIYYNNDATGEATCLGKFGGSIDVVLRELNREEE